MDLLDLFVKIGVKDEASKKIGDLSGKIKKGLGTAAKIGAAGMAALGASAVAAGKSISNTAVYADNIDKMSQKMGLSAKAYQEWDFIMQHSGTSMESLKAGMKTMANAVDTGNEAFSRLGITQTQIQSLNQEELFSLTIEQLQKVDNETERTYLAGQLLGRGATELGALLNTSAEDTEAMRKQVHELGGVLSDEGVKAGAAFQDSLQNLQVTAGGLTRNLSTNFFPSIVNVMDGLSLLITGDDRGFALIEKGTNDFIDNLNEKIPKFFEVGSKIVVTISQAIVTSLPALAEGAVKTISTLVTDLGENFPKIVEAGVQLIKTFSSSMVDALPNMVYATEDIILAIVNGLTDNIDDIIQSAVDIVISLAYSLSEEGQLRVMIESAAKLIVAIIQGLSQALPQLVEEAPYIITSIVSGIVSALPAIFESGAEIIGTLAGALIDLAPTIVEAVRVLIQNICYTFFDFDWAGTGSQIIESIKVGIQNAWASVANWFNNAWYSLFSGRSVDVGANVYTDGSHAGGLDYVPYNGYIATLHRGERVLTADENKNYQGGGGKAVNVTQNIYSKPMSAADLMQAAANKQRQAVFMGV